MTFLVWRALGFDSMIETFDISDISLDDSDKCVLFAGQIELYTHLPVMRQLVEQLQQWEFRVCGVFLVDSQFMVESFKVKVDQSSTFCLFESPLCLKPQYPKQTLCTVCSSCFNLKGTKATYFLLAS